MTPQPNRRRSKPHAKSSPNGAKRAGKTEALFVRASPEEHAMLATLAVRLGISQAGVVRMLIRNEFRFGCSQGHRGGIDDPDR